MRKKLLFIEANTTGTGMTILNKAKDKGFEPVFITNKPERYLGLSDVECLILVCDTNSLEELSQTIENNFIINEISGIMTTSEYYLPTVAYFTEKYGMPGNPIFSINICRNKAETRLQLEEAHIDQPKFAIVESLSDLEKKVADIGFPCIVKPLEDSGSSDVLLCKNFEEAKKQFNKILNNKFNGRGQKKPSSVLIEEFLDGDEYSVEMFTVDGDSFCIGITEKGLIGKPYFVEYNHVFPSKLYGKVQEQIINTVTKALHKVDFKNGASHTEVKLVNGICKIIEINARLAGGMIPELIYHATGVDLLNEQINAATGNATKFPIKTSSFSGIQFIVADRDGILKGVENLDKVKSIKGIKKIVINKKMGTDVFVPRDAYDRIGFVIAKNDDYESIKRILQKATDLIELNIQVKEKKKENHLFRKVHVK